MKPPAARTRIEGAPSMVVMNSSARPPLIEVTPVANVPVWVGTAPPMLLPMTPGASCATCEARRPLSGVSAICSARTVRPITEVSTSVVAASTCTTSLSAPTSSATSTRMFTPAFTRTSDLVRDLKPDSEAVMR